MGEEEKAGGDEGRGLKGRVEGARRGGVGVARARGCGQGTMMRKPSGVCIGWEVYDETSGLVAVEFVSLAFVFITNATPFPAFQMPGMPHVKDSSLVFPRLRVRKHSFRSPVISFPLGIFSRTY